jgi:hypothetical protein
VRNIFRGFGAVFYKEALHVRRDAGTLFFSLTMPLLQMFLLGFGVDTNIRQIHTVVYNADGRRESRELIDRLKNSDTFHILSYVENDHDLNDLIIAGRAHVGIKIPVDYSDRLLHNMSAQVLVLIDGSDSSVAGQAINVTTAIGLDESLRRVLKDRSDFAVEMRPKLLFNPDSRSPNFFLPGLTAIMLLNVTTFLTAFSIVREKERGTLEQLFVRRALAGHPHLQQSQLPGGSHAARFPANSAQCFLLRLYFPARNHASPLQTHQLPYPCHVFHQYHARCHPSRRRHQASLDRRPRPLRDRHHSPDHRRPPLPEQSHHGVNFRAMTRGAPIDISGFQWDHPAFRLLTKRRLEAEVRIRLKRPLTQVREPPEKSNPECRKAFRDD